MKTATLILLAVILCMGVVSAADEISITIDAPSSFTDGEQLSFDYTITSLTDRTIAFVPSIFCDGNRVALLDEIVVDLASYEPYSGTYADFVVDEHTNPGMCTATLMITKPTWLEGIAQTQEFTIDTAPVLETRILTCADEDCTFPKSVFLEGEEVHIVATTKEGEPVDVESEIPFVNGKAVVEETALGVTQLATTSSKVGYKRTISEQVYYAVIEDHPRIAMKAFY